MNLDIHALDGRENVPIISVDERNSVDSISGEFNPNKTYGLGTEINCLDDREAIGFLHRTAKQFLFKGTRYEIRAIAYKGDYKDCKIISPNEKSAAAWIYDPDKFAKEDTDGLEPDKKWDLNCLTGCYTIGPFEV